MFDQRQRQQAVTAAAVDQFQSEILEFCFNYYYYCKPKGEEVEKEVEAVDYHD